MPSLARIAVSSGSMIRASRARHVIDSPADAGRHVRQDACAWSCKGLSPRRALPAPSRHRRWPHRPDSHRFGAGGKGQHIGGLRPCRGTARFRASSCASSGKKDRQVLARCIAPCASSQRRFAARRSRARKILALLRQSRILEPAMSTSERHGFIRLLPHRLHYRRATMRVTRGWRTTSFSLKRATADAFDAASESSSASFRPSARPPGRSLCDGSPVTTMRESSPSRVRNIFICAEVQFCASSRMTKARASVRPRMKASGATSMTPDLHQLHALLAHHVEQRVVERAQIGIDLLLQIAGQKAEALAGFERGPRQDQPLHAPLIKQMRAERRREIGLAGSRRVRRRTPADGCASDRDRRLAPANARASRATTPS